MAIQERMKKKMEAEAASRQADVDVHLDTRPLDSKGAYSTQHLEDQQLRKHCQESSALTVSCQITR